jgi:hypothetical protein
MDSGKRSCGHIAGPTQDPVPRDVDLQPWFGEQDLYPLRRAKRYDRTRQLRVRGKNAPDPHRQAV